MRVSSGSSSRGSDLDGGVGGFKGGRSASGPTHPRRIPVSSLITNHPFFHLHLFCLYRTQMSIPWI